MLKPDDVPTYVEHGATDAGVVGRDVAPRARRDLYVPLDLGLGRCRMVVAAPDDAPPRPGAPPRGDQVPPHRAAHYARAARTSR
jgi:ATP phosphoribosyltransferase